MGMMGKGLNAKQEGVAGSGMTQVSIMAGKNRADNKE